MSVTFIKKVVLISALCHLLAFVFFENHTQMYDG